jgi:Phage capsid protein
MSFQIETAFVKQYHDVIYMLLQQKGSRLRGSVRSETQNSEASAWEQIGPVEATEATDRHGDSPLISTPHARRWVTMRQYEVGDMLDNFDKVKLLIDPTSSYVQNFVNALGRKIDDTVITAFRATVQAGKNFGDTSYAYDSTNQDIAVTFGGANSNLTVNKLIEARTRLLKRHVDPSDEFYVYASAQNVGAMLKVQQVTSSDYNTVRALVNGEIDTYLGFKWIIGQRAPLDTNSVRDVYCWVKSGMLMAMGKDISTRVAERPDKRFSTYAYAALTVGAVRMEEFKVVTIRCDETV